MFTQDEHQLDLLSRKPLHIRFLHHYVFTINKYIIRSAFACFAYPISNCRREDFSVTVFSV